MFYSKDHFLKKNFRVRLKRNKIVFLSQKKFPFSNKSIQKMVVIKVLYTERNFVNFVTQLACSRSTISMTFGWLYFYEKQKSQFLRQNTTPFKNPWF